MISPRRPSHSAPLIEPLESRIAPAGLIAYNYSDSSPATKTSPGLVFVNAADPTLTGANLAIAETVGQAANVYFIKVTAGQDLEVYTTSSGAADLINVTHGTVVAFFTDSNPGNVTKDPNGVTAPTVVASDLTGLSVGANVTALISGGISHAQVGGTGPFYGGDVVTNYNDATGTLGGTVASRGHAATTETPGTAVNLLPNAITNLTIAGPVAGDLVAGAKVSFFQATGSVNGILTGTAANGYTYGFEGVPNTTGNTTLVVGTPGSGVAGPSISSVFLDSVGAITLGAGGPGAAGGSLNSLTVINQIGPAAILGGAGGAGIAGKAAGGAGGTITNVVFNGPSSGAPSVNPNSLISIIGGAGGAGLGPAGGGKGGTVTNVYLDYSHSSTGYTAATTFLAADVLIQGGAGGSGGIGGTGGSLNNINVLVATPHNTGAPTVPELQLLGGAGGSTTIGGRGGAGGSITNTSVLNLALPSTDSSTGLANDSAASSSTLTQVLVQGGAGGSAAVKGPGGAGGAIGTLTLEGYNFSLIGGAGGQGISGGGAGGSISTIQILGSSGNLPGDNFHDESLYIQTGTGGNGVSGAGGAGGSLKTLTIQNADFGNTSLFGTAGFQITTGAGGQAGRGKGGPAGSISGVQVTEVSFLTDTYPVGLTGTVNIATGAGGSSPVAGGTGGAGGSISTVVFVGDQVLSSSVTAGAGGTGGAAGLAGRGGAGGAIIGTAVHVAGVLFPSVTTASAGLLLDTTANFVTDNVVVGDPVQNTTTGVATTVTSVSATELGLASDIFAVGDQYNLPNESGDSGSAQDSQDTIVDANTSFIVNGVQIVQVGDVVTDITNVDYNNSISATLAEPTTGVVTAVGLHTLTLRAGTDDISHVGDQYTISGVLPGLSSAIFTAGAGGNGFINGAGGAGGSITGSSANVPGNVTYLAGAGGNGGATAAPGIGGTLKSDGTDSISGSSLMTAGNAGTVGGKAAAGGSIISPNIQAPLNISLFAGNGFNGGAGGSIATGGYTGAATAGALSLVAPSGNVTIDAGAGGSSATGAGGAGGSISNLTGFISLGDGVSTDSFTTQFNAGAGGNGVSKGGAGGSVTNVNFFGGGGTGVTFFINAGDAGNASAGKTGATGGSVTNIGGGADASSSGVDNLSIDTLTNFHHISAGNGGNATLKGGQGGSVGNVFVNAAIGVRTGVAFGFDLAGAGGISAGAGGAGATAGLPGNVTRITADAIASIVAGHMATGQGLEATNLAGKVDDIILNGSIPPSQVQQFDLSFNGATTSVLPSNATPIEIAAALNSLSTIQNVGGVTLLETSTGIIVTFNKPGVASSASTNLLSGQEPSPAYSTEVTAGGATTFEVQNVQVIAQDGFTLTFEGDTTSALPAGATPAQVQTALDALPNLPGGVTVVAGTGTPNPSYQITFDTAGPQGLIVPNFTFGLNASGTTGTDVQTLTFPTRGDLIPAELATANFVGSIDQPLRTNATVFNYTGYPAPFVFGDAPIDGLIAATDLTAFKSFVPEAYVTEVAGSAVLVDSTVT